MPISLIDQQQPACPRRSAFPARACSRLCACHIAACRIAVSPLQALRLAAGHASALDASACRILSYFRSFPACLDPPAILLGSKKNGSKEPPLSNRQLYKGIMSLRRQIGASNLRSRNVILNSPPPVFRTAYWVGCNIFCYRLQTGGRIPSGHLRNAQGLDLYASV